MQLIENLCANTFLSSDLWFLFDRQDMMNNFFDSICTTHFHLQSICFVNSALSIIYSNIRLVPRWCHKAQMSHLKVPDEWNFEMWQLLRMRDSLSDPCPPEDLFVLAINWGESGWGGGGCGGHGHNYGSVNVSEAALGHVKLPSPLCKIKYENMQIRPDPSS